jgi:hypothetical protein
MFGRPQSTILWYFKGKDFEKIIRKLAVVDGLSINTI